MLISYKENLIFIHIPKCGGTTIIEAFKRKNYIDKQHNGALLLKDSTVRDSSHFTLEELIIFLPDIFKLIRNTEKTYAAIRDPFKRFISAYFFERRLERWIKKNDGLIEDMNYFLDSVIESYEKKIFVHKPRRFNQTNIRLFDWRHRHAMPQILFLKYDNEFVVKNLIDMSSYRPSAVMNNEIIEFGKYNEGSYNISKFQDFYKNENDQLFLRVKQFYKEDFDLFDNNSCNII